MNHCILYGILVFLFLFTAITNHIYGDEFVVSSYYQLQFRSIDRQLSEYSCGIAVLTTLFNHYFEKTLLQQDVIDKYVEKIIKERRGVSFLDLKKVASDAGFSASGFKLNYPALLEFLNYNTVPLIIHLNVSYGIDTVGHFCLLLGRCDDFFIIQDPAYGNCIYKKDQLLDKWSGNILVILPPKDDGKTIQTSKANLKKAIDRGLKRIQRIVYYESR